MEIRRLGPGDETFAAEIIEEFFLEPHHEHIDTFLCNRLNYLLVAIWEDIPVGVLLGYELQRPESRRPKFFVYEMEVLDAQRGRGIGTEIFLLTNRSNIPAMRLYKSTGGIQEGEDNVLFVYRNLDQ